VPRPANARGEEQHLQHGLGSYARSSASRSTPEELKPSVETDVHSNDRFRVNGVPSNMPQFAEAFGCKAGRPLARENRCQIWGE
jgi:putative endopeptidase